MIYYKFYNPKPIYYFCEIDYIHKTEIFKDFPNYIGHYMISDLGRVKSLKKNKEKIIVSNINTHGYLTVGLYKNGFKGFKTHKLVAISFLGHIPCGHNLVVDHKNNNQTDNREINLQIITPRQNASKDKKNKTSNYIGVSWDKVNNKWKSVIVIKGKTITLGRRNSEIEANELYQNKLKEYESSK